MQIRTAGYGIIALCLICGAGCSQRDDRLIVPGERVGPYKLHQARSKINGGGIGAYARPAGKGLLLSFEGEQVSVISVGSPDYHTDRGLRLGSATNEVIACYGRPDLETNGYMVYQKLGIEFQSSDGKVGLINVLDKK